MYISEMNFAQAIDEQEIGSVVARALGYPPNMAIRTEARPGEFPYTVRVYTYDPTPSPSLEQFHAIARSLNRIFLTDDVAVGELWDDGFSLISPDGSTAVVRATEESLGEGHITLLPESRQIYDAARSRLNTLAAD